MFEQEFIDDLSKKSEWRCPHQRIFHQSSFFRRKELVNVLERLKSALDHFVNKQLRPLKLNNLDGQPLPHPKMCPLERHRLSEADRSIGLHSRFGMNANIAHKVEARFGSCIDLCFEHDLGHGRMIYGGPRKYKQGP